MGQVHVHRLALPLGAVLRQGELRIHRPVKRQQLQVPAPRLRREALADRVDGLVGGVKSLLQFPAQSGQILPQPLGLALAPRRPLARFQAGLAVAGEIHRAPPAVNAAGVMRVRLQHAVLDGLMRFQNLRDAVQGVVREDFQDPRDVVAVDQRVARVCRARTGKLAHELPQRLRASVSSHRVDVGDGYNSGQSGRKSGRKPRVSLLRRVAQRLQSPRQRLVVAETFKEFDYFIIVVDGGRCVSRHQRVEGLAC
ncbi:MAG: hypothetical protein JFR41_11110 [Muribaculaceae bacterium]|nr:hypothetical protein [Muribaculaceae bacterium]